MRRGLGPTPFVCHRRAGARSDTDTDERPEEVIADDTAARSARRSSRASLDPLDVDLYDLELDGGVLRVTIDRPGGIDIDAVARRQPGHLPGARRRRSDPRRATPSR